MPESARGSAPLKPLAQSTKPPLGLDLTGRYNLKFDVMFLKHPKAGGQKMQNTVNGFPSALLRAGLERIERKKPRTEPQSVQSAPRIR